MRSLAAGVTLVGTAAALVTPIEPVAAAPTSSAAYRLTASVSAATGSSLSNVPVNAINMVLSMPAWEIQAMGRLADAMVATGSWQVWGPTNVLGFDEQDPPKLAAIVDMMIPVQPFSTVLGDQLNWWAKANLPMNAGCAAMPSACPDPGALLSHTMTVPIPQLFQGYQFPEVTNPFTDQPTSWSGAFVKLDPGAATKALLAYLTAPPVGVATVSPTDAVRTVSRLGASMRDGFYPFVQNSEWFDTANTPIAPVFRALAPALCKSCGANPYDNPWLANYSPKSASTESGKIADPAAAVEPTVKTAVSVPSAGERGAEATAARHSATAARHSASPARHSAAAVGDSAGKRASGAPAGGSAPKHAAVD